MVRETLFSAWLDLGTQTGGSDETKKVQRRRHTVEKLSQVGYTQLDGVTHAKAWNLGLLRSTQKQDLARLSRRFLSTRILRL